MDHLAKILILILMMLIAMYMAITHLIYHHQMALDLFQMALKIMKQKISLKIIKTKVKMKNLPMQKHKIKKLNQTTHNHKHKNNKVIVTVYNNHKTIISNRSASHCGLNPTFMLIMRFWSQLNHKMFLNHRMTIQKCWKCQ